MNTRILGLFAVVLLAGAVEAEAVPYRVLLESDANADPGDEVFALSYASWADLLAGDFSDGVFTQIGISSPYSIADFTFDGTAYRMLLESDANADPGDEVFALTYTSWSDLLAGDFSDGVFTQIGISSPYSIAGFDAFQADPPTASVPEPGTLFMLSICLASALAGRAGRQRLRLG